jgi:CheY-like chemotaxis protein
MTQTVLVVEDNQPSRELVSDWLEMEGFRVVPAANLEQAFAAFEDQPLNVVLLDVQLGAEDGLLLAKWVREDSRFRHIPVVAVTAHAMVTDQERVMQAGCNACVSKPIDFRLLQRQLTICLPEDSFGI